MVRGLYRSLGFVPEPAEDSADSPVRFVLQLEAAPRTELFMQVLEGSGDE